MQTRHELLEREGETERLSEALAAARAGIGRVLVIEGAAGLGKTALLQRAISDARRIGVTVQAARGFVLEQGFVFGVVRHLLQPALAAMGASERDLAMSGAAALAGKAFEMSDSHEAESPATLFPMLHGLYWLWANLTAGGPLLIALDDAQWSDHQSLEALCFLAHRIEDLPILLLVAIRTGEPDAPEALLDDLRSSAGTPPLKPLPLSAAAARALLDTELAVSADELFVAACQVATGGNPFYLQELARAVIADGIKPVAAEAHRIETTRPDSLARNILLRLGRLSQDDQRVARALAVMGHGTSATVLSALVGIPEQAVTEACDRLSRADIVDVGAQIEFVHPIVRAVIYDDIPGAHRALAHSRAANALMHQRDATEWIAMHLLKAPPAGDEARARRLLAAGLSARAKGAPAAAATYFSRALAEEPDRELAWELHLQLGMAEAMSGGPDARRNLESALRLAESGVEKARAACELTNMLIVIGEPDRGAQLAWDVADTLGGEAASVVLSLEAAAASALGTAPPDTVRRATKRLEQLAPSLGYETAVERELLVLLAYGRVTASRPPPAECATMVESAIAGGLVRDGPDAPPLAIAVSLLTILERYETAERTCREARDVARERGSLIGYVAACTPLSSLLFVKGRLRDAESEARAALASLEEARFEVIRPWVLSVLVTSLVARGKLDEAEDALEPDGRLFEPCPPTTLIAGLITARGRLRLARGRYVEALDDLMRVGGFPFPGLSAHFWRGLAARALIALDRRPEAIALMKEELTEAGELPRARGAALRDLGLARGGREGLALLEEAVTVLQQTPCEFDLARALADWGAGLRHAKEVRAAREPLRRALEIATRIGADPLAEYAREELRATGAKPRRDWIAGVESLTASERRVAQMAAEGMSNPQIAQALFITRKTVEKHLGTAFAKLEIGARSQLTAALAEPPPQP
jgi:DNA-binding CsgD family transcriptional regulator